MALYRSTENEDKLFDYFISIKGTKVTLAEIKTKVEGTMGGTMTNHPYDRRDHELRVFWQNSTFYHGAYIKCVPCNIDGTEYYDVSEIKWYTEVDRHPIYF